MLYLTLIKIMNLKFQHFKMIKGINLKIKNKCCVVFICVVKDIDFALKKHLRNGLEIHSQGQIPGHH